MITLVLLACLAGKCETINLPFDGGVVECAGIGGMVAIRVWMLEHPGYIVQRYGCGVGTPT